MGAKIAPGAAATSAALREPAPRSLSLRLRLIGAVLSRRPWTRLASADGVHGEAFVRWILWVRSILSLPRLPERSLLCPTGLLGCRCPTAGIQPPSSSGGTPRPAWAQAHRTGRSTPWGARGSVPPWGRDNLRLRCFRRRFWERASPSQLKGAVQPAPTAQICKELLLAAAFLP